MAHSATATVVLLCLLVIAVGASVPISRVSALNVAESIQDIVSNWSVYPVTFDGMISNEVEWSDAQPQNVVLYRRDLSPQSKGLLPDDNLTATYYVKNDAEWLYLLVHVTLTIPARYTDIILDWPVWNGTYWPQSDASGVNTDNQTVDAYGWNNTSWQFDEPNNVKGAAKCTGTDCWFEYAKMLHSGDEHDWNLNLGDPVGGFPPYLQVGIWFGETGGLYHRLVRLYLAKSDFPNFFGPTDPIAFDMPIGGIVYSLSFDNTGSLIAVGLRNPAEVRLYSRDGSLLWKKPVERSWAAYSVALSSDGRFVAAGTDAGLLLFSANGTQLWDKRDKYAYSVSITANGERIAYTSGDRVAVVDRNGGLVWTDRPAGYVQGVCITSDGGYVAVLGEDKFYPKDVNPRLFLYDRTGNMLWYRALPEIISGVGSRYSAPTMSSGADLIVVLGQRGKLVVFDRDGSLKWTTNSGSSFIPSFGLETMVSVPNDGHYIAAAAYNEGVNIPKIHLFSPDGLDWGSLSLELGDYLQTSVLRVSPDGSYLAAEEQVSGVEKVYLLTILNSKRAIDFLSNAVKLGFELGVEKTNQTEMQLHAAQEEMTHGSLTSAYDLAARAYATIEPEFKIRLLHILNETERMLDAINLQFQTIDKSAGGQILANVSSRLQADANLLASTEIDIKAGTLVSYEKAFRDLDAVKQSLLQDQSLLSQYNTNRSSTAAQVIEAPFSSIYVGVVFGLAATALILALVVRRIRSAKRSLQETSRP